MTQTLTPGSLMTLRSIAVALLLVTLPATSAAQATPEEAATAFGTAVKGSNWAAATRMMHPSALAQMRSLFNPIFATPVGAQTLGPLFSVSSAAEFAALPDTVMFARFLGSVVSRQDGLADAMRTLVLTPLGHVNGGGDTVLVVIRTQLTVGEVAVSGFEVSPWIKDRGRWWALLKTDYTNMAAMLQARLGQRS